MVAPKLSHQHAEKFPTRFVFVANREGAAAALDQQVAEVGSAQRRQNQHVPRANGIGDKAAVRHLKHGQFNAGGKTTGNFRRKDLPTRWCFVDVARLAKSLALARWIQPSSNGIPPCHFGAT